MDLDPGRVTVEAGGLIQANLPVPLRLMLRAQRVATGQPAGLVEVGAPHE